MGEEVDIRDCCYRIICLYQRTKPNQEDLEKIVDSLKAALDEKRKAAIKGIEGTAVNSPSSHAASPVRKDKNEEVDKGRDDRSRSRSNDRNKRKKKHKQRDRSASSPDRDRRDKIEEKNMTTINTRISTRKERE